MKSLVAVALVLSLSALCGEPSQVGARTDEAHALQAGVIADAAGAWVASLTAEQRGEAVIDFDDANRMDWHFFPRERRGLTLGSQTDEQRMLLSDLLREILSDAGWAKVHGVFLLEEVIGRDPLNFHATLFGDPAGDKPWGFRLEGHHVSINVTVRDGSVVTAVPMFFGASPAEVRSGVHVGFQLFLPEEQLARELVGKIDVRRKEFMPEEEAPKEIFLMPGSTENFEQAEGVPARYLDFAERSLLMRLLTAHVNMLHPDLVRASMGRYRAHDILDIHFLWRGSREPGQPFYYRISSQKKDFAVEFANFTGDHTHVVWRDFSRDFGGDPAVAADGEDG